MDVDMDMIYIYINIYIYVADSSSILVNIMICISISIRDTQSCFSLQVFFTHHSTKKSTQNIWDDFWPQGHQSPALFEQALRWPFFLDCQRSVG